MYRLAYTIKIRRTYIDENAHSFRIKEIYAYFILVQMLRGRIVQINDKSMKIGTHGNFGTLNSKRSGPTLDFAQEGSNLQSKMSDIENVNFSYIFK